MDYWKTPSSGYDEDRFFFPSTSECECMIAGYGDGSLLTIDDFTRAIELDPALAVAYYMRGASYGWADESSKANQDFAKACELDSSLC